MSFMRLFKTNFILLAGVGLLCASWPLPSSAQEIDSNVANRLNRLENEVSTLGRAVYKGQAPGNPALPSLGAARQTADLQARLQQMEEDMRGMTGTIEEQAHEIRMLQRKLDQVKDELSLRVQEVEQNSGVVTGLSPMRGLATPEQSSENAGQRPTMSSAPLMAQASDSGDDHGKPVEAETSSSSVPSGDATAAYENAFSLLKQGQYHTAQLRFEEFLKAYPDHALASNAKYWLGETFYVRGEYEQASRLFAEGFQAYPKGAKAPDNLLKLGITLGALGKKGDACVALGQVAQEFPAGAASVLKRAEKEMQRLACGT